MRVSCFQAFFLPKDQPFIRISTFLPATRSGTLSAQMVGHWGRTLYHPDDLPYAAMPGSKAPDRRTMVSDATGEDSGTACRWSRSQVRTYYNSYM
jgi:hypothetical protein